jgi:hypothetical protein
MSIKIEKHVAMPKGNYRSKYPLRSMTVGDSFFMAAKDRVEQSTCRSAVYMAAKRCGFKVSCHNVEGGLRVWRTE